MNKTAVVYCHNQIDMIHHYPNAPENVKFLRYPHRHLFKIKVAVQVYHNDRDIEFITLKQDVQAVLEHFKTIHVVEDDFSFSCEDIADYIYEDLVLEQPEFDQRLIIIDVSEDGENGANIVYEPKGGQDGDN